MSAIFQTRKQPRPISSTSPNSPTSHTWQLPSTRITTDVEKILGLKSRT